MSSSWTVCGRQQTKVIFLFLFCPSFLSSFPLPLSLSLFLFFLSNTLSPVGPGWPQTGYTVEDDLDSLSSCLYLLNLGIRGKCHHVQSHFLFKHFLMWWGGGATPYFLLACYSKVKYFHVSGSDSPCVCVCVYSINASLLHFTFMFIIPLVVALWRPTPS